MVKRRWKDRKDGQYLRDADPMHKIMPFLMPKRTETEVFLLESVDVTNLLEYVNAHENDGSNVTMFSTILAMMVRLMAERPSLNNFIVANRTYHRNTIDVGFVIKKEMKDDGQTTTAKVVFDDSATVFDVSTAIYNHIEKFRNASSAGTDDAIGVFAKFPRPVMKFAIWMLNVLNFYGRVPKFLEEDPNFSSVFVANLGSIKGNAPFHHLNNWGTNSFFVTIGAIYDKPCAVDGNAEVRPHMDLAITVDERIADGFYFMRSVDYAKKLLANPELLEKPFVGEEEI